MAITIEDVLNAQAQRQAPAMVQAQVPAILSQMMQGGQQGMPQMPSLPQLSSEAPRLNPMPDQGQMGSGIGKTLINSFVKDYFDERKATKTAEKNNEYLKGLKKDASPIERAMYLMQSDEENVRRTGADIYQSITSGEGKQKESPETFEVGDPTDPMRTQRAWIDPEGITHVISSPRSQFAGSSKDPLLEERKLESIDAYRKGSLLNSAEKNKVLADQINAKQTEAAQRAKSNSEANKAKVLATELKDPIRVYNIKQVQESQSDHDKLVESVNNYKKVLSSYDQKSRHNPLKNSALETSYQSVTWPARGKKMLDTGVMNVGDYPSLAQIVTDPTKFDFKGARSNEEIFKQLDEFVKISEIGNKVVKKNMIIPKLSSEQPTVRPAAADIKAKGGSYADYLKSRGR
jgi:hypothetical protein